MKTRYLILAGLLIAAGASAQGAPTPQGPQSRPQAGLNGQTMAACTADLARLCASRSLKQECLVQHWTSISGDCQDALARPMRRGGGGGG